jgi:N-acetyltransferase
MPCSDEFIQPARLTALSVRGVRLEPLGMQHLEGVIAAANDGALWNLRYTSVPTPQDASAYIQAALAARAAGERLHFAVLDATEKSPSASQESRVIGCTSYHDILPGPRRVEIGWTWYAKSVQRSHVNTACKWLLMVHAFETLDCLTLGWRTSNVNFASQRAIERLGAKKDGVIRGQTLGRDGSVRDTVMYSLTQHEWRCGIRQHMQWLVERIG